MKKKILFGLIALMIIISACTSSTSYTDCGSDKDCVVDALVNGEKSQATFTETEQQGEFTTTVTALIRSEGKQADRVLIHQEILEMNVNMPEIPPLPEDASDAEKQQFELSTQFLESFANNFKKLEKTSLDCSLDPAKVSALGVDETINEAMQASIDPVTLKPIPDGMCKGSMIDAYASIMSNMMQMLSEAMSASIG